MAKDHFILVYADFNSRTNEGYPWILKYDDDDLSERLGSLKLKLGDRVILFQDEDDFRVPAILAMGYADELKEEVLCAIPDWGQISRK
jgi:hypothetical protein